MIKADELLHYAQGRALIGDSGYDSDRFARRIRRRGMKVVINCKPDRKLRRRRLNRPLYRIRYRVECFFHDIKRFRAVATRYDKTARNYLAMVQIACACKWLN